MPIHIDYFTTPVGELILGDYEGRLCLADWHYRTKRTRIDSRLQHILHAKYVMHDTPLLQRARSQLHEYFALERRTFTLPLLMVGSPFQKSVWQALCTIPFGATLSYAQLAGSIGKPHAVRAVANANSANAISIMIPCHRIISSNGTLGGYAGGLDAKKSLLALEKHPNLHVTC